MLQTILIEISFMSNFLKPTRSADGRYGPQHEDSTAGDKCIIHVYHEIQDVYLCIRQNISNLQNDDAPFSCAQQVILEICKC